MPKGEACEVNRATSPNTFSVIEIEEDEKSSDEKQFEALPLDDEESNLLTPILSLKIGTLDDQCMDRISEAASSEDETYISDIDI